MDEAAIRAEVLQALKTVAPEIDPATLRGDRVLREEVDLYRSRTDEAGIRCQACHGAPHAVYPAVNRFEANRDVLQPMQYQDNNLPIGANGNCKVCHTIDMEYPLHHENMMGPFRNTKLMSMRSK